jgi:hypothetical protein
MSDFPQVASGVTIPPLFVSTLSELSNFGIGLRASGATTAPFSSGTWPVNDRAVYVPVYLPWDYPVARVFWVNGNTITSTAASFAIYNEDKVRLYTTGSVSLSGAAAIQYTTPSTPFVLKSGMYYFGYSCNSFSSNRVYVATVQFARAAGIFEENSSAHPCPATPTFADPGVNTLYPAIGITQTASGF